MWDELEEEKHRRCLFVEVKDAASSVKDAHQAMSQNSTKEDNRTY